MGLAVPKTNRTGMGSGKCLGYRAGDADLYSLGVVLYEMLAGRPPFVSEKWVSVLVKHCMRAPPSLESVNPNVDCPQELLDLLDKLLEKDPEDRCQSARELRAAALAMVRDPDAVVTQFLSAVPPPLPPAAIPVPANDTMSMAPSCRVVAERPDADHAVPELIGRSAMGAVAHRSNLSWKVGAVLVFLLLMGAGVFFVLLEGLS